MQKRNPVEVVTSLLNRSTCAVQVAACVSDPCGIHAWGWNSAGLSGMGEHAEAHCLRRANRGRLLRSVLWVAARRQRNGRPVTARPCLDCQQLIKGVGRVMWRDGGGVWRQL